MRSVEYCALKTHTDAIEFAEIALVSVSEITAGDLMELAFSRLSSCTALTFEIYGRLVQVLQHHQQ